MFLDLLERFSSLHSFDKFAVLLLGIAVIAAWEMFFKRRNNVCQFKLKQRIGGGRGPVPGKVLYIKPDYVSFQELEII